MDSYSDLEAEHYAKMKEKQLREQANQTALPDDIDTAPNATEDIRALIKTMSIVMFIGAICIGVWAWTG